MPSDLRSFLATVTAQVTLKKLHGAKSFGVFIEDLPPLDPTRFVEEVIAGRNGRPVRIAVLGTNSRLRGADHVAVTTSPTDANVWRNDSIAKGGTPTVILLVGPAPKVNSLRTTFPPISQADVREEIANRALRLLDSPERRAFWQAMRNSPTHFPLQLLARFAMAVEELTGKSRAQLMEQEWRLVHLLSLIPQRSLLSTNGPRSAASAIRKNRAFVAKLRSLGAKERSQLLRVLESNRASDEHKRVAQTLLAFDKRGDGDLLKDLDYDVAQSVLRLPAEDTDYRDTATGEDSGRARREQLEGDALAVKLLLDEAPGVKAAAKRFAAAIDPTDDDEAGADHISVNRREILPRARTGTAQATTLFGRLLSEEVWGGVIAAPDVTDHVAALKMLTAGNLEPLEFRPLADQQLRWMLSRAVNQGLVGPSALAAFDTYAAARKALLPAAPALADHPLLALAGSEQLAERARAVVNGFSAALSEIQATAERLRTAGSVEPAKRLLAYAVCLDAAFIDAAGEWTAVVAPTHPFHLWHWLSLLEIVGEHRQALAQLGPEIVDSLISEPPAAAPDLVLSPFAVRGTLPRSIPFVPIGSFGALPLFAEPGSRNTAAFRSRAVAKIAERFVRLMPHASFGLRVLLIDPPSIAGVVEELLRLTHAFDEDQPVPPHVLVARTRPPREDTDEEDQELEAVARDIRDAGGSLVVLPRFDSLRAVASQLPSLTPHLSLVFDPGDAQELRLGIAKPPALSPLIVPRAYRYDPFDDRLDVVVAGEDPTFASYHSIFCELLGLPRSDFIGRRSGASRFARDLEAIAGGSMWMTVVDQGIEPTLNVGGAVRLDWRSEGGRDLVTYTAHQETVEELVSDAIHVAGLVPTEETTKRTLRQLLQLSGESLLALAKPRPDVSMADRRIAKGVLGVLAAARWYSEMHSDSVLVSLDEPASRRWILGTNDDNRHGDLLGVRIGSDGVVLDCIEVKAYEDPQAAFTVHGGRIEGRAVTQVDQTIRLLRQVFASRESSPLDRARLEILKDQLYRAVASRPYPADQRARFVQMLEELFDNGPARVDGVIVRVSIRSGEADSGTPRPRAATSPDGNQLSVVDLIETEASAGSDKRSVFKRKPKKAAEQATSFTTSSVDSDSLTARAEDCDTQHAAPSSDPAPAPTSSAKHATAESARQAGRHRVRLLVGRTAAGEEVFWDPQRPDLPLNNFGLLVTGDPGSGKTQILRAVVEDMTRASIPACVFDFKNDYSDNEFAGALKMRVFDVDRDGLPFNPLTLVGDQNGEVRPIAHIHELAGILRRIFRLGDQQEAQLKRAMQQAFVDVGISVTARQRIADLPPSPSFDDVVKLLAAEGRQTVALLNRLSPLFDLNLFPTSDSAQTNFEELLASSAVLDLHKLPDDRIKAALAEFLIVRLHGYVLRGEQPRQLRRLLVFDEAWRVKDSERLQELAREGRAFGVGIAIGTQFPGDIPETLAGNLASQLLLHNGEIEHRKSVARTLVGSATGPVASQIISQTQALKKHEGFFRNQQYSPYVLLTTIPHYQRR